jgi:hypothetical protein
MGLFHCYKPKVLLMFMSSPHDRVLRHQDSQKSTSPSPFLLKFFSDIHYLTSNGGLALNPPRDSCTFLTYIVNVVVRVVSRSNGYNGNRKNTDVTLQVQYNMVPVSMPRQISKRRMDQA